MPDVEAIAREYFAVFNRRDWDGVRSLLHDEYSYTGRGGVRQDGPEAGIANSQMYARLFPDLRLEIKHLNATRNVAVVEFVTASSQLETQPSGGPTPLICTVLEMRDGKVHTEREYWQQEPRDPTGPA